MSTSSSSSTPISNKFSDFNCLQKKTLLHLEQDFHYLLEHVNLPSPLQEACHYAMTGKGKKLRPLLVASSFISIFSLNHDIKSLIRLTSDTRRAMLAVELLHTYSLVHDDLPCMDDDNLRRGRATTHIKYGEATALLVGDVLQSLAFEVLTADIEGFEQIDDVIAAKLVAIFSTRTRRMVAGQMLDLQGENKQLNQQQLQAIHVDKTGALIESSILMGAECAGANLQQRNHLQIFSEKLGLAFQVQDDVLDVLADTEQLGKPAGSDEKLDKSTYVKLMGIESAQQYAKSLFGQATGSLSELSNSVEIEEKTAIYNKTTHDKTTHNKTTNNKIVDDVMLMQLANWLWLKWFS